MFSQEQHCLYRKNQLGDVICQLRFPEILIIGTDSPAAFQEEIREDYPLYSVNEEPLAPKITGQPGHLSIENQPKIVNHQFVSQDGMWRINLTSRYISLSCRRYTSWEAFAQRLDKPLAAFIRLYRPAFFERIGLRYLNFFSRQALDLTGTPLRELFTSCYLGPLAMEAFPEQASTRCSVDSEFPIQHGCRLRLHAGPGLIRQGMKPDPEVKFILDLDLYMPGKIPVNYSAGAMQTLHQQAFPIFRDAITDTLHEAMEPTEYI